MPQSNALIIFAVTNQIDRSNQADPLATLPWDDLDALYTAFLSDTLRVAIQLFDVDVLVYRNTKEISDDFFLSYKYRVKLFELDEEPMAEQVQQAVEDAFQVGYQRVTVLLENNPLITDKLLRLTFTQLGFEDDCIVYGPTDEDRCYLVGMKADHSSIFKIIESDPLKNRQTLLKAIMQNDVMVFPMVALNALDSGSGLLNLKKTLEEGKLNGDTPSKTLSVYKMLEKKYRFRKIFQ
ncbi:MAG: hypothetical protein HZB59_12855 [Ignavibacteriales bacterium]|nr:hypothetical protein [Ignavibacteriales bacterium]